MKHTPGPWVAEIEEDRCLGIHPEHDHAIPGHCRYRCPAQTEIVTTDSGVYGPCAADAVLIAAAPELLDALIALRSACEEAYKAGRIPAEPFVTAGNVIAKATGEGR